ncbi:hypothetical protein H6P81_004363 [Aristolochia fimbriata]|uniref:Mic1 domain-containing protein n=1 Tax=Aristolochia fimbriata TaxID=158543 RepID=A0AAV7FF65_ARIFI|nr:hypothetical protein H6P81_004363 [Aristolochia fimbriata]
MFTKYLSDQPRVGLGGAGALSHVYIQHPSLKCSIPESKGVYYDDGNKLLLLATSDQVFSWDTSPSAPLNNTPGCDSINEGPVVCIRYSLDGKIIGIQRSNKEIEFKIRETGEIFTRRCKSESESILGFFWTDCPTCDIVLIKTSGLELLSCEADLKTLRSVEMKRLNVSWYMYTHESRLVLLSSGMQCKTFSGFQFSSGGIIRLPKFEMAMTKADVNQKPVLAAEDIHIVTVYGRIYCLQVDSLGMMAHLYRFYRDAVVQQGSLPIYSAKIAVSVVDNVLLVHQVDAKVVILYDIFACSQAPISAPLPLLLRGDLKRKDTSSHLVNVKKAEASCQEEIMYGDGWIFLVPDLIFDTLHGTLWRIHLDLEAIAASNSEAPFILEFLQHRRLEPSKVKQLCLTIMRTMILERRPVTMVSMAMDVLVASYSQYAKTGASHQGVSTTVSDSSRVVVEEPANQVETHGKSVIQEPDIEPSNPHKESSISDSDEATTTDIQNDNSGEHHNMGAREVVNQMGAGVSTVGDVETSALQSETVVNNNISEVASAAISPDEMFFFVFAIVEEEMASDPSYLVAIIIEYFQSVTLERLRVHPNLHVMTVQLLSRSERYPELGFFVINKIVEPSREVALQLLDSGRHNFQTRKLALDMLRQLGLHHDYILLLVQDGYYLEALRYARKNKVDTIRPSVFLEAALSSKNPQHLAAVLRCLSDFIPSFRSTPDYTSYSRVLKEIC